MLNLAVCCKQALFHWLRTCLAPWKSTFLSFGPQRIFPTSVTSECRSSLNLRAGRGGSWAKGGEQGRSLNLSLPGMLGLIPTGRNVMEPLPEASIASKCYPSSISVLFLLYSVLFLLYSVLSLLYSVLSLLCLITIWQNEVCFSFYLSRFSSSSFFFFFVLLKFFFYSLEMLRFAAFPAVNRSI